MMSAVPTELERLLCRLNRNNRQRVSARPTSASPANLGRATGRKGGGGFTGRGTHLTLVAGGTTLLVGGRPGLIRRSTPCGTSTGATAIVDGYGEHWRAPPLQLSEVRFMIFPREISIHRLLMIFSVIISCA